MSAVETGQMSSAETGQMSAVPESSGLPSACGAYEVAPAGVERALLCEGPLPLWAYFSMFLGCLKIDAKMVPKK